MVDVKELRTEEEEEEDEGGRAKEGWRGVDERDEDGERVEEEEDGEEQMMF